jgi:hypothetical protein
VTIRCHLPAVALSAPLRAFLSWNLRVECGRCGRERYLAEMHMTIAGNGDIVMRDLILRLRHERCGGEPHLVELVTGISAPSSRGTAHRVGRYAAAAAPDHHLRPYRDLPLRKAHECRDLAQPSFPEGNASSLYVVDPCMSA